MRGLSLRHGYRFIFAPGTIGTIAWLARNQAHARHIKHGLVVSMLGDAGGPTYKKTRQGTALIDRAAALVLRHSDLSPRVMEFTPYGYDERQYCSPGFNLPVGLLQRSAYGTIPEYHTSGDNLHFITPDNLAKSFDTIVEILNIVENDAVYINKLPFCEPQLGKRGLYHSVGGDNTAAQKNMATLWLLNLSDGLHSLVDIAERSGLSFRVIHDAANLLEFNGLLAKV
jgi:aminopeptidase-like protein